MKISWLSKYNKTLAAVIVGLLAWSGDVIAAGAGHWHVDASQWHALAGILAVSFGVYTVPNTNTP